jgi:hypothetical protein
LAIEWTLNDTVWNVRTDGARSLVNAHKGKRVEAGEGRQ